MTDLQQKERESNRLKNNSKQLKLTDFLKSKTHAESDNINGRDIGDQTSIEDVSKIDQPRSMKADLVQDSHVPIDLTPISSIERTITSKSLASFQFPTTLFGKVQRSFQAKWLDSFEWLEYSVSRDAAFCFPCRAFSMSVSKADRFTVTGFNNWKKAQEKKHGFHQHEASLNHIQAMSSWQEKRNRFGSETTVSELLSNSILQKRRFYMMNIIEVIIFLAENELAFRGDWDYDDHREIGTFRNLFEFKLKDSEDLRSCQQIMPKNCTYLSPDIQNELISIIAKLVEEEIVNDINSADVDFFTVLVDGTKDRKNHECVSIAARYMLNGKAMESLLGFENTKDLDAESNAKLILAKVESCGLLTSRIISQCYDGANVMSGDNAGIQRIIQNTLKRLVPYVHCFNHRLHLVIIAAVDGVYLARIFFENIKLVYTFFRRTKVQAVYKGKSILNVIEIRWAGHVRATNVIYENLQEIINTLSEVKDNKMRKFDADDVAMASGIKQSMMKKEFLFMLAFNKEFLNLISPADKILQSRDVGYREALPIIDDVLSKIIDLRSTSNFERILKSCEDILIENSSETRPTRKKTRPTTLSTFIITEKIGERNDDVNLELKSAFNEVIDIFTSEMKRRFTENSEILIAISTAQDLCYEKLAPLKQVGIKLPTKEEMSVAKAYIERQKREYDKVQKELEKDGKITTFKERFNVSSELFKMREAFPEVYKMMAAVDTFGSSTTICECSFSALDRIGTPKRICMNDERLLNLTFLAFEKKKLANLSVEEVLKRFNKNPKRKLQLY